MSSVLKNVILTILFLFCTTLYVLLTGWYAWHGVQHALDEDLLLTGLRLIMIYVLTIGYLVVLESFVRDITKYKLARMLFHDETLLRETLRIFHWGGPEARRRLYTHLPFLGRFLTGIWDVQHVLLGGPIITRVSRQNKDR